MLAEGSRPAEYAPMAARAMSAQLVGDGEAILDFTPQEITLTASVDARFVSG